MLGRLLERLRGDRGASAASGSAPTSGARLALDPAGFEAIVLQVLTERGAIGLGSLMDLAADRAMRVDQGHGAWNADIAVWGPSSYRREATQAVLRMLGESIALQSEEGHLLAVPVNVPPADDPPASSSATPS